MVATIWAIKSPRKRMTTGWDAFRGFGLFIIYLFFRIKCKESSVEYRMKRSGKFDKYAVL
jgi:hypothetical protein